MNILKSGMLITLVISMSGCIIGQEIQKQAEDTGSIAQNRLDKERLSQTKFKRHDMPFISGATFLEPEPTPDYLHKQVMIRTQTPLNLKYYSNNLSLQIGRPVRIGQDIYSIDDELSEDESDIEGDTSSEVLAVQEATNTLLSPLRMKEKLTINASAEDALNIIASSFNVHWKYDKEQVIFYKTETRTFRLSLLMNDSLEVSYNGAGSEETSGSLSTTSTSKYEGGTYTAYVDNIKNMLSSYGSVDALPNTGAIIVTDTPEKLGAVEDFLKEENKTLLKQVALDVEIVMVSSKDGKDVGMVWNSLLAQFDDVSFSGISNQPSYSESTSELSMGVKVGKLAGSSLLLQALAQKARVSVVTRETRTVLNNTPAQFRDVNIIEYPSETEIVTDEGVTTVSTTKDTIRPGFDMNVLPRITDDNRIILNVVTSISRNTGFDELTSDTYTQKFANMSLKELKTTEVIRDSDTAMLTGYINSSLNSTTEGTGHSDFWLLGGGNSSGDDRDMLIIFVTPHIIKS